MNGIATRVSTFVIGGVIVVALAACSAATSPGPVDPAVSEERAMEIATNALNAYNAGDYGAWSRDWSPTMKSAIKERDFLAFRDEMLAARGRFVGIDDVEVSSRQTGTYRYTFEVLFEKGSAGIGFAFYDGGPLVEGVFVE